MKTLYESILDDEETLIGNSIKDSQNPFYFVSNLMSNKFNLKDYKQEIDKAFKKFIKDLKPSYPIKIVADTNGIKLTLNDNTEDYDPLIILRPAHLWSKNDDPYGFSGDQKMIVFFSETFIEDYRYYGFEDETDYIYWIKMIAKKYNLNKSKKDSLVYYI